MKGWRSWLKWHRNVPVLVALVVCSGVWGFIALADEVFEGETRHFDEWIILALRVPGRPDDPLGPGWLEETARDFTALGSLGVLLLLTAAVVGYLLLLRKRAAAWLILIAVAGGQVLSMLLKHGFNRPRPELVPHETQVYTASFPSGHSMMSAITYLTLGAMLIEVQKKKRAKIYLLSCAALLAGLTGLSRIYLGVHWPTDVLAGWMAGAAWASLCWLGAQWFKRRTHLDLAQESPGLEQTDG